MIRRDDDNAEEMKYTARYVALMRLINRANSIYADTENTALLFHLAKAESGAPILFFLPHHMIVKLIRNDMLQLLLKAQNLNLPEQNKTTLKTIAENLVSCSTVKQFNDIIEQTIALLAQI